MRMNRYILLVFSTVLCGKSYATEQLSAEDEAFIKKHRAPLSMVKALDRHTGKFSSIVEQCEQGSCHIYNGQERHLVWQFKNLSGYFVKYGIDRIHGAEKIQQCIDTYGLDRLAVPKKYIYHIKGKGRALTSSNYLIVAKKLDSIKKSLPFDDEQVCQICTLLRETGYNDFVVNNLRWLPNGKIGIIDTEGGAFNEIHSYVGLRKLFTSSSKLSLALFSEESIKYMFLQLLECAPQDKSLYKNMYKSVYKGLKRQKKKKGAWDYLSYFVKLFPKPE